MSEQFLISGKVQGVSYRWYTCEEALKLKLKGFVRNLSDGRVEVCAEGSKEQLDQLYNWLKKGSPHAKVDLVERTPLNENFHQEFFIDRTI